jgi:hypothetical protein
MSRPFMEAPAETLADIHASVAEFHATRVREEIAQMLEDCGYSRSHVDKMMPRAMEVITPIVDADFIALVGGRNALN